MFHPRVAITLVLALPLGCKDEGDPINEYCEEAFSQARQCDRLRWDSRSDDEETYMQECIGDWKDDEMTLAPTCYDAIFEMMTCITALSCADLDLFFAEYSGPPDMSTPCRA